MFSKATEGENSRNGNLRTLDTGSGIYEGKGGASKNVNGVDIWLVGTPPRKFRIIGYITDSRPGGLIPMARRDADLAAEAKKNGGDGPSCLRLNKPISSAPTRPGNATAITSALSQRLVEWLV